MGTQYCCFFVSSFLVRTPHGQVMYTHVTPQHGVRRAEFKCPTRQSAFASEPRGACPNICLPPFAKKKATTACSKFSYDNFPGICMIRIRFSLRKRIKL